MIKRRRLMINIVEKLDQETEKRIKQFPHPNNRASEAGHPCTRFLVLSRLHSELKELHDVGLQRIFDEGRLHEKAVLRELEEAGFQVVEQQRSFEWKKFQLSGHIDGKIEIDGKLIPLDIKSCSPNIFPAIEKYTFEEMLNSNYTWIRKYPAQILLYMIMDGAEEGILLFKDKGSGRKCQKNFNLKNHLEYTESILKKLEIVNSYVDKGELPEIEKSDECRKCDFCKTVCFPGQDYGPGFDFISDEELEAKLLRREELKNPASEYKKLDREIKDQLKGKNAVIGDFLIESKEYERKSYNVPNEIKNQYLKINSYFRVNIEKLKGKK
jgi:hypothetical protein